MILKYQHLNLLIVIIFFSKFECQNRDWFSRKELQNLDMLRFDLKNNDFLWAKHTNITNNSLNLAYSFEWKILLMICWTLVSTPILGLLADPLSLLPAEEVSQKLFSWLSVTWTCVTCSHSSGVNDTSTTSVMYINLSSSRETERMWKVKQIFKFLFKMSHVSAIGV